MPADKHPFITRRTVTPVTGFYEWKRGKKAKRAYCFQPRGLDLFLMAGIWDVSKEGEPQCCIVTTEANGTMQPIHHRMPVLLNTDSVEPWIVGSTDEASEILHPSPDDWLSSYEVSGYVNDARNQGDACIAPLS